MTGEIPQPGASEWLAQQLRQRAEAEHKGVSDQEIPPQTPQARRITLEDTIHFEREGFEGWKYPNGLMMIGVHGSHPSKRIDTGERRYTVVHIEGEGEFTLNGETFPISKGDEYIIPAGAEYSYHGENMTLIEENAPDTTDTRLDLEL